MSSFTEAPTTESAENTNPAQGIMSETNEDYIARVAQEKGEQWRDPQTLAKGYVHAQQRIKELEAKAEELGTQDYAKQLLAQLQTQTPTDEGQSVAPIPQSGIHQEEVQTTPTPEAIQSLIEQTITQREQANSVKKNLEQAEKLLADAFGTESNAQVRAKSQELGMPIDKLEQLASESPSAFMALMGKPQPKETNSLPKGQVSTEAVKFNNPNGERNWNYYNNLRKENPKHYRSPQIQQQMMQDRQRLGEGFNT